MFLYVVRILTALCTLFLLCSCTRNGSDQGAVKIDNLTYSLVDSVFLKSNKRVRYLNYSNSDSIVIFSEGDPATALIAYDVQSKSQSEIFNTVDIAGEFGNIITANVFDGTIVVLLTSGYCIIDEIGMYTKGDFIAQRIHINSFLERIDSLQFVAAHMPYTYAGEQKLVGLFEAMNRGISTDVAIDHPDAMKSIYKKYTDACLLIDYDRQQDAFYFLFHPEPIIFRSGVEAIKDSKLRAEVFAEPKLGEFSYPFESPGQVNREEMRFVSRIKQLNVGNGKVALVYTNSEHARIDRDDWAKFYAVFMDAKTGEVLDEFLLPSYYSRIYHLYDDYYLIGMTDEYERTGATKFDLVTLEM